MKRIEARRRIKKCAEERTEKFNADHKLVTFKTGEKVPLRALNAVSYTHLDVYKRQVMGILTTSLTQLSQSLNQDRTNKRKFKSCNTFRV